MDKHDYHGQVIAALDRLEGQISAMHVQRPNAPSLWAVGCVMCLALSAGILTGVFAFL